MLDEGHAYKSCSNCDSTDDVRDDIPVADVVGLALCLPCRKLLCLDLLEDFEKAYRKARGPHPRY